jgi:hypothetical protein
MQAPKVINITGLDGTNYTVDVPVKKNKHWAIIQDYNYVYEKVPLQDYAIWFMNNRNEPSRFILYKQLQEPDNFKIVEDYCKKFCTEEQFGQLTLDHKLYMFCCNLKTFEVCPHCKTRPKSIKSYKLGYAGCCGNSSCMSYENHRCNPGRGIVKMKQTKANRSPEKVKEEYTKAINTIINRYATEEEKLNKDNVTSPLQLKNIKDKRKKTYNERYENGHPMRDPKCIEKKKQTSYRRYGVYHPMKNKAVLKRNLDSKINSNKTGGSKIKIFTHYFKNFKTQGYSNMSLKDAVKHYTVDDIDTENDAGMFEYFFEGGIHNYTPDIIIHSENLIIETKSKYTITHNTPKILAKVLGCLNLGYNVIIDIKNAKELSDYRFIFQSFHEKSLNINEYIKKTGIESYSLFYHDELINSLPIIESFINIKIDQNKKVNHIRGSKCYVERIFDKKIVSNFYNKNHLQGNTSSTYHYGLFKKDTKELVSMMSFSKPKIVQGKRKIKNDNEYELTRFCTLLNNQVYGGASKLLSKFIEDVQPELIYSYSKKRISNSNNVYTSIGFERDKDTRNGYSYILPGELVRKDRYNFAKFKLVKMLGDDVKDLSEFFIMKNIIKARKIEDTGNFKYTLDVKKSPIYSKYIK